ncbi:MAG: hypothetical protein A2075_06960 [Geobacteraceae bacterium GWC2_58_44]|nr:MAG: hypothetical protein A2075_06960 [Geobacteraceae bacterium GWC2_58_44]HBG04630.1 hypothetical protein [Geobacter sp.]
MKKPSERFKDLLYLLPRFLLAGLLLFCILLMLASNFDYLEPHLGFLHSSRAKVQQLSPRIAIGPYPHLDEMRQLQKQGFSGIISLLDDAMPQERALNRVEERAAGQMKLGFWKVPIGYLQLDSQPNRLKAQEVARILAGHPGEKIYLHCYLGRHRVELVRRMLVEKGMVGGGTAGR